MFECKINILKLNQEMMITYNEFHIPCSNFDNDPNNPYSGIIETIIIYESIHTIYKILKRLKHFSSKLEYEFQQNFIASTINNYKPILSELRDMMYKPLCNNILKIDHIFSKITGMKWDPSEEEVDTILFLEPSGYIDEIYREIIEKYEKIDVLTNGTFTERSKRRFLGVMIENVKDLMMESLSKVKKVNKSK